MSEPSERPELCCGGSTGRLAPPPTWAALAGRPAGPGAGEVGNSLWVQTGRFPRRRRTGPAGPDRPPAALSRSCKGPSGGPYYPACLRDEGPFHSPCRPGGSDPSPLGWGDLGPFNPGLPVDVPLWLAVSLKQRQKCRVLPPEWMDVEKLEKMRDHERNEETFTPMPSPYYMELTKLLLNHASDNIPKADEIRTLVKDTWDTRIAKLRVSADSFVRQQEAHAQLDNLTLMEINTSGAFLTQALNHMYKLRTSLQPPEHTQSQDF
ncbi:PREDICTED: DNA replication complex GINS protein PSF2 [Condylura cristata]|uniref:DNA replication complex GINS protein PSF2 n=1 Tax=Condylura cristata TaxID=143302 RepID=UPI00033442D3|nr:PREDICTED: DNA replication complex GINS protein PSF2 [Condylura cristata]